MKSPFLLGVLLAACSAKPPGEAPTRTETDRPADDAAATPEPTTPAHEVESVALHRAIQSDMTEVVLAPDGKAAVTLGRGGDVSLWEAIQSEDAQAPWRLPIREPLWLSVAKVRAGAFVVAHLDTTNGGHVGRVDLDTDGARYVPLFDIPPSDPLFELRVLAGGERILALGIDHRVRLYDTGGEMVSEIAQKSFVPWQLRLEENEDKGPAIVAVLARPTRAQRITLKDDELTLAGEPQMVALDQSPNRNDLALSPDGKTIGALRRPKHRGKTWWLELIDVDTGARRKITGDADTKVRPRLHLLSGERALLHAGTSTGQLVDLSKARRVTIGEEPPPPEDFVDAIAVRAVHASGEARMQATVAGGVFAVAGGAFLTVDAIDDGESFKFGAARFDGSNSALSPDGTQVLWWTSGRLFHEMVGGEAPPRPLPLANKTVATAAFIDDARYLVATREGNVTVRSVEDGEVESHTRVRVPWGIGHATYRRGGSGTGQLGLIPTRASARAQVVEVRDGALTLTDTADRARWADQEHPGKSITPRLLRETGWDGLAADAVGRIAWSDGRTFLATRGSEPDVFVVKDGGATQFKTRHGAVRVLLPDPTNALVAVVQSPPRRALNGFDTLTLYDVDGGDRLWTRAMAWSKEPSFSADGSRISFAGPDGGEIVDARTGSRIATRRHQAFEVHRRPVAGG